MEPIAEGTGGPRGDAAALPEAVLPEGVRAWSAADGARWRAAGPPWWARALPVGLAVIAAFLGCMLADDAAPCTETAPCGAQWAVPGAVGLAALALATLASGLAVIAAAAAGGAIVAALVEGPPETGGPGGAVALGLLVLALAWLAAAALRARAAGRARARVALDVAGPVTGRVDAAGPPRGGVVRMILGAVLTAAAAGQVVTAVVLVERDDAWADRARRAEGTVVARHDAALTVAFPDGTRARVPADYPEEHARGERVAVLTDGGRRRLAVEGYDPGLWQIGAMACAAAGVPLFARGLRARRGAAAVTSAPVPVTLAVLDFLGDRPVLCPAGDNADGEPFAELALGAPVRGHEPGDAAGPGPLTARRAAELLDRPAGRPVLVHGVVRPGAEIVVTTADLWTPEAPLAVDHATVRSRPSGSPARRLLRRRAECEAEVARGAFLNAVKDADATAETLPHAPAAARVWAAPGRALWWALPFWALALLTAAGVGQGALEAIPTVLNVMGAFVFATQAPRSLFWRVAADRDGIRLDGLWASVSVRWEDAQALVHAGPFLFVVTRDGDEHGRLIPGGRLIARLTSTSGLAAEAAREVTAMCLHPHLRPLADSAPPRRPVPGAVLAAAVVAAGAVLVLA